LPTSCNNQDDGELARRAEGGDRQAYGVLVDRHLPCVYAVIRRIVFNSADAEDLAQDTFVRALTRLDQYGRDFPFRNWLLKIATNVAINHIRSRQRERARYPRIIEDQIRREVPESQAPSAAEWQVWLDKLDPAQRTALVLFHFEEMPYAEIAQVMEMPVNTVRTHLHRGRHRLKELMTAKNLPEKGSWTVAI
jgi:RNA polymerase sigma-70 factor (ECF subfamily)